MLWRYLRDLSFEAKFVIVAALLIAGGAVFGWDYTFGENTHYERDEATVRFIPCEEDDPCWDGSWRDSNVNPGVAVDRWEHAR